MVTSYLLSHDCNVPEGQGQICVVLLCNKDPILMGRATCDDEKEQYLPLNCRTSVK